jgi:hypothetical protein
MADVVQDLADHLFLGDEADPAHPLAAPAR